MSYGPRGLIPNSGDTMLTRDLRTASFCDLTVCNRPPSSILGEDIDDEDDEIADIIGDVPVHNALTNVSSGATKVTKVLNANLQEVTIWCAGQAKVGIGVPAMTGANTLTVLGSLTNGGDAALNNALAGLSSKAGAVTPNTTTTTNSTGGTTTTTGP